MDDEAAYTYLALSLIQAAEHGIVQALRRVCGQFPRLNTARSIIDDLGSLSGTGGVGICIGACPTGSPGVGIPTPTPGVGIDIPPAPGPSGGLSGILGVGCPATPPIPLPLISRAIAIEPAPPRFGFGFQMDSDGALKGFVPSLVRAGDFVGKTCESDTVFLLSP